MQPIRLAFSGFASVKEYIWVFVPFVLDKDCHFVKALRAALHI